MNRFINAMVLFFTLQAVVFAIYVGFDLPIGFLRTTGAYLRYIDEVFIGYGIVLFMLVFRRAYRRWMALRIVNHTEKFIWNMPVSSSRKKRIVTYSLLETAVYTFGALGLYFLTELSWIPASVLLFGALDTFVLTWLTRYYRVALSSKAIIVADREVVVVYFTGLRKITVHQQTIYFDYIKDLQLSFPLNCIAEEHRSDFFSALRAQMDPEKVYFPVSSKTT